MRDDTNGLIWYLGYGSNMNRGIFEGRRGMRPIHAQPALLETTGSPSIWRSVAASAVSPILNL